MRSGSVLTSFSLNMYQENSQVEINESIIFSVSEVTLHLKQVIETQIEALYIVGEISNFVRHSSGHIYFNLKDDNATMRCAFFRNQNYQLDFNPSDGDQVICFGRITVFEKSGQYQLLVQNMFPYGKGALQQKFEQLKLKLKAEGLFDAEHKKPIPEYPETIGVITSPTGAALQDILNILQRRYPCKVQVYPALMQGIDCPNQVIKGIEFLNKANEVDLIIIARGGGSQEDLFGFNDEQMARAIFASDLPVVSAIGHEIDFTIADFVSDLRAPTPSAAAELVTPDIREVEAKLNAYSNKMKTAITNHLNVFHRNLQRSQIRLMQHNPERIWQSFQQRYDEAVAGLLTFSDRIKTEKRELQHKHNLLSREFVHAYTRVIQYKQQTLEFNSHKFRHQMQNQLQEIKHRLEMTSSSLEELSPLAILKRGYALVNKQNRLIRTIFDISAQDSLDVVLSDGSAIVTVTSIEKRKK